MVELSSNCEKVTKPEFDSTGISFYLIHVLFLQEGLTSEEISRREPEESGSMQVILAVSIWCLWVRVFLVIKYCTNLTCSLKLIIQPLEFISIITLFADEFFIVGPQMTDARCKRCMEKQVGLREIIQTGHGDRYQVSCICFFVIELFNTSLHVSIKNIGFFLPKRKHMS